MEEEEEELQPRFIKKSAPEISRFVFWKKDTAPNDQDARLKAIEDWHNITNAVSLFYFIQRMKKKDY